MTIRKSGAVVRALVQLLSTGLLLSLGACSASDEANVLPEEGSDRLRGEIDVLIATMPDAPAYEYYLNAESGERYELKFSSRPELATGDRVKVDGETVGDHVVLVNAFEPLNDDDGSGLGTSSEALTNNSIRTSSKLAVLLVHWSGPDSQTVESMRGKVFTNTNSTSAYYKENSYNLLNVTGDVFGWFQIQAPTHCGADNKQPPTDGYRIIAQRARDAAAAAGVPISNYQQFLYYFPNWSTCQWSGLASVGLPTRPQRDTWYNGASGCVVLAQEILHNFGAIHSRSYDCGASRIDVPASCTFSEYGDLYDPMGGGCYHTNIYQKAAQGWLGKCNNVTVTANGTFDIVPTQAASNSIQSLRIPMNSSLCPPNDINNPGCYYYVDYRQPILFDANTSSALVYQGVQVHVAPGANFTGAGRPGNPYLLDMTPGSSTSSDFRDSSLAVGQTFTDPNGVSITLESKTTSSARVRVAFPNGGAGSPLCIDGSVFGGGETQPSCTDLIKNGTETDVDCGGSCADCANGKLCVANADCQSNNCVSGTCQAATSSCATGESSHNGHCYVVLPTAQTFASARTSCQARGSTWDLAVISSVTENSFVRGIISADAWLGGSDSTTEGTWRWVNSTQFWPAVSGVYTNWEQGEPNNLVTNSVDSDCVRMITTPGGTWRDIQCSASHRPVCESGTIAAATEQSRLYPLERLKRTFTVFR